MSSVYTGLGGNVGALSFAPTTTIPADGDADNAASFNTAFQKLTDYVAAIAAQAGQGFLWFLINPGNVASTTYYAWACASLGTATPAVNPTATTPGATSYLSPRSGSAPQPGRIALRGISISGGGSVVVGGTVTIEVYTGGSATGIKDVVIATQNASGGTFTDTGAGSTAGFVPGALNSIELRISNGVGVTTSVGQLIACVQYMLN